MEDEHGAARELKERRAVGQGVSATSAIPLPAANSAPPTTSAPTRVVAQSAMHPPLALRSMYAPPRPFALPMAQVTSAPTALMLPQRPKIHPTPVESLPQTSLSTASTYRPPQPLHIPEKHVVLEYDGYGRPLSNWTGWDGEGDGGLAHRPGTTAYYKSYAFRKKRNKGEDQVPGRKSEGDEDVDMEDAADDVPPDTKKKSLVMILSRTSVRRAKVHGKAQTRLQRQNKRMKALRRLDGEMALFGWD